VFPLKVLCNLEMHTCLNFLCFIIFYVKSYKNYHTLITLFGHEGSTFWTDLLFYTLTYSVECHCFALCLIFLEVQLSYYGAIAFNSRYCFRFITCLCFAWFEFIHLFF